MQAPQHSLNSRWVNTTQGGPCLVGAKVSELEVKVAVQHTVLRLDVAVVDTAFVEVYDSQQNLCEVVAGQWL